MPYEFFQIEKNDGVAKVTINRPPSNAMSVEFTDELKSVATEMKEDQQVRSVLFRSALPKYFITGADLKSLPPGLDLGDIDPGLSPVEVMKIAIPRMADHVTSIFGAVQEAVNIIEALPKPTVVIINGHALGGGLEVCLACDFRIMARGPATIGLTEVNLGLMPVAGGTQRLTRILGRGKAIEMVILGRRLNADEAEAIGLIYKAVDPDELEQEGEKLALDLAQRATCSIAKAKECIYRGEDLKLGEGLTLELECIAELMQTGDTVEGISSFIVGKKPEFKGC
jgi:enoyl-CoA hydratase/carnithine racemase